MYHVIHPDGTKDTLQTWSTVEPLFDRYNIDEAATLKRLLSPETIALAVKEDGGSP